MICQNDWPAAARKSTNRRASGPKSPMPKGPGRDVGCSRTPLERSTLTDPSPRVRLRGEGPAPQDLGDAPRLRDAAPRRVGLHRVEDLADRADAGLVEVRDEAVEEAPRARAVLGMHLEPRVDERADEPRPDGALVIRGIARAEIAVVGRLEVGMIGRERAQADGRHELRARDVDHRAPSAPRRARGARARWRGADSAGTRCRLCRPVRALDDVVEIARPPGTRSAR